jgi:hypothetical protein
MRKLFTLLIFTLVFATYANAQKPVYDRNNVMTAIYNIGVDEGLDTESCSVEKIVGKVLSVSEDYPEVSAVILTSQGKQSVSVNTESMSMADRSNFFYSLLKKGKRVQIGAYMCGSGGFMYATSVKVLSTTTTKRKKK